MTTLLRKIEDIIAELIAMIMDKLYNMYTFHVHTTGTPVRAGDLDCYYLLEKQYAGLGITITPATQVVKCTMTFGAEQPRIPLGDADVIGTAWQTLPTYYPVRLSDECISFLKDCSTILTFKVDDHE